MAIEGSGQATIIYDVHTIKNNIKTGIDRASEIGKESSKVGLTASLKGTVAILFNHFLAYYNTPMNEEAKNQCVQTIVDASASPINASATSISDAARKSLHASTDKTVDSTFSFYAWIRSKLRSS